MPCCQNGHALLPKLPCVPCLLSSLLLLYKNIYMAIEMRPNPLPEDEHTFWQKLILPEEERRWIRDWEGGYRMAMP
jgi:hypothetical protein